MLTAIDLFAGAGGLTEGLARAGIQTLVANEQDEMAAATFRHNHADIPVIQRDISEVSAEQFLETSGKSKNAIGLVCGGPPCQGFSLAGQRLDSDPRNQLFKEFVRVVDGVRPQAFLFENVSGLISMSGGKVLRAIINEFENIGYNCAYKVLNSSDYGTPQSRPRFILLGFKVLSIKITFPEPTHIDNSDQTISLFDRHKPSKVSVWDALSDLPFVDQGCGSEEMKHENAPQNEYQSARRGHRAPSFLFNHRATRHNEHVTKRFSSIPEGKDNSVVPIELRTKKVNVYRLDSTRPSRTVTCNLRTDLIHPRIPRGLTVREAARLQGFDDDYQFFGNLTRKAKYLTQDDQVGNAVPPLLAETIGKHLIKILTESNSHYGKANFKSAKLIGT